MGEEPARADAAWLTLREPADAVARSVDLVDALRTTLTASDVLVVHDLGCGSGSMARWLAPQLPGPQRWVLHDRDQELLDLVGARPRPPASDGAPICLRTTQDDITRLGPGELTGSTLVTASALLDMLTAEELERLVTSCAALRCPVLIALSVTGVVELRPVEPLDQAFAEAFNAHQRRTTALGRLLGPDAHGMAVQEFERHGFEVRVRPSPWRLGPTRSALSTAWLDGWVAAACEQAPALTDVAGPYTRRRAAELAAGRLWVTVHHQDLLALPR
jgi:hypothetical protein